MKKSKLSITSTSLYRQLAVVFGTMTILPILALSYFLFYYLYPDIETVVSIPLVVLLTIVLSLLGFFILSKMIKSIIALQRYVEAIASGDLSQTLEIQNGAEINSIGRSVNVILRRLQQAQQTLKKYSRQLETGIIRQSGELKETRKEVEKAYDYTEKFGKCQ